METFMYFWLNYSDGNNHIERSCEKHRSPFSYDFVTEID